MKIALVCSSGGHLFQLFNLKDFWEDKDRFWVTFPTQDTISLLKEERVLRAYYPTNRNIKNLVRNLFFAWRVLRKEKPTAIISTGAGVAVPFIYIGKLLGMRIVYIETIIRPKRITLTGHLIYFIVDKFLVQWPELAQKYKRAEYHGKAIWFSLQ